MCTETSYRFESKKCGCVYVYVVTCEEARIPVDNSKGAKPRWPDCKAKGGVRRVDGSYLAQGCWLVDGKRGKKGCENR